MHSNPIPVVAIVGRPNVGKSSLFNWLAGRRIAIVEPTAGVTRDRLTALVQANDQFFELVDTGGMGSRSDGRGLNNEDGDSRSLTSHIERQIKTAIDQADVILFVVDVRAGLMPPDQAVAKRLRPITKPVLCVVNKCDTPELEAQAAEFFELGREPLICVSAMQSRGKEELLAQIGRAIQERPTHADEAHAAGPSGGRGSSGAAELGSAEHAGVPDSPSRTRPPLPDQAVMKLAIVGRRNTGKSTFINSLAQAKRMIVSEVPGTTRDSVDVRFERDGQAFIAIDTAGVRRKRSIQSSVEFYSLARAERSVRRADVVLLFLDPKHPVSKVDKQLANYILENYKPAIFVVNKWDLMRPMATGKWGEYIRATFPSLEFVPIVFITAKNGKNVQTVLNLAQHLYKQAGARVTTGELNRVLNWALERQSPPLRQNRRPKVFYATQVSVHPPTLVLFSNGPELFDKTYVRYLETVFRDHLPFHDVPMKLYLRNKRREDKQPALHESSRARKKQKASSTARGSKLWKDI
jgi:GTP-binding protein